MIMPTLSARFAHWAHHTQPLSSAVTERAQMLLADFVACAARGAEEPPSRAAAMALCAGRSSGDALGSECGLVLDAETTAFLNGMSGHSIELDDTHEEGSLHAGTVVWPAVLALADEGGAACDKVLHAATAGYDVMCHLGVLAGGQTLYERGFHPTGICGVVGATVGAGIMLDLDERQLTSAMGIAASFASGTLAFLDDGGWTKPLHAGAAATHGIRAARMAQHGFQGPESGLDGRFGMLWAFAGSAGAADDVALPPVGSGILESSVKLHPCCRYIHGVLDLLLALSAEESLDVERIKRITCTVLSGGFALVAAPADEKVNVSNQVEAQFSLPYAAALLLTRGEATLDGFRRASELAPSLRPLMERVECVTSPELDRAYPARWGAAVSIEFTDGRTLERATPHMRGSPAAPLGWTELEQKIAGLLDPGEAADLIRAARRFSGTDAASLSLPARIFRRSATRALETTPA